MATQAQTPPQQPIPRMKLIEKIWQDNRWLYIFSGWLIGLMTLPFVLQVGDSFLGLLESLIPEAVGIAFTVFIVDWLAKLRETETTKKRLLFMAKSKVNSVALNAIEEIRFHNWDKGDNSLLKNVAIVSSNLSKSYLAKANMSGTNLTFTHLENANLYRTNLSHSNLSFTHLENSNLYGANLNHSDLAETNISGANLSFANLKNTNLDRVNLSHADVGFANLSNTYLINANLYRANLSYTNLAFADMRQVNLEDTNLRKVNLLMVDLTGAQYSENTVLPDAEIVKDIKGNTIYDKYWTPETDMARYVYPNHPDFWQPDWAKESEG